MENLDCLVVLGARIGLNDKGVMAFSRHMEMRAMSAHAAAYWHPKLPLVIAGGFSFGVRYPLKLSEPTFPKPNFSKEAREYAKQLPSESAFIALWLNDRNGGASFERMHLDQVSETTTDNATYGTELAARLGAKTIGVLSMAYHLNRPRENAMKVFAKACQEYGLNKPVPVYTEHLLWSYPEWHRAIHNFYADTFYQGSWSGFRWDADEICRRLDANETLVGLEPIGPV